MDRTEPPPVPPGLRRTRRNRVANELNTTAMHAVRRARTADTDSRLSPERLSLLSVLVYDGPATMSALAEAEQVSPPAITRIVQSLERVGLVTREVVAQDRRRLLVRATDAGARLLEEGRRQRLEVLAEALRGASAEELDLVSRALAVVRRQLA
jgi:DNA-binding MarR family transcriptional regulator